MLRDEIRYHQDLLNSLDANEKHHVSTKTRLEEKLSHLTLLLDNKLAQENTRQYQEDLKFLEDSETGKISESLTASPGSHRQKSRSVWNSISPPTPAAAYPGMQSGFDNHCAPDHRVGRHDMGDRLPSWSFASTGGAANDGAHTGTSSAIDFEPSSASASASASASSPDQGSLAPSPHLPQLQTNPRKRQRESIHLAGTSNDHVPKTLRATPSPAVTGPTTPSSMDEFNLPENSAEFFRLMGGDPKDDLLEMREEQIAQERMLREKREQERMDEEYAKQLEEQMNSGFAQPSQEWSTSHSGRQSLSQGLFDANGNTYRPDPMQLPSSSSASINHQELPVSYNWPVQQGSAMQGASSRVPGKPENRQLPSTTDFQPTEDFIDLSGGDEYDNMKGDGSSDIVEIGSFPWPDSSGVGTTQRQLPWTNKYTTSSNNADTANMWEPRTNQGLTADNFPYATATESQAPSNSYGNPYPGSSGYVGNGTYDVPAAGFGGTSGWNNAAGQVGQTFSDAAKSVINAAYSVLDSRIGSSGYNSQGDSNSMYGNSFAGSSNNPFLVPDHDFSRTGQPSHNMLNNLLKNNSINADDPKNKELVDRYVDRVNYLTNDPTRTSEEIKSLLENIRPDEDLPPENREGTPDAMTYPLMEHQKLGLAWMKSMEEGSNKGGILADDMGLGKTIQALALMVSRRSTDPNRKTTLIVAPVALMKQWEREIQRKLKPGRENQLTCYVLHGSNRQASWEHLKTFDVVLTTFGTLANEVKRKEGIELAKQANPNWRAMSKSDRLPLLGGECKWFRVIIDEAQCIKNKNTKAALGAASLQSLTRFCMSGTPMMNNVSELYSLIHFLRIKPYNVAENFNRDFSKPLRNAHPPAKAQAMQKLQALLKAILLRRTKRSRIDGKPILTLPERNTESQHAVFSEDERDFYRALETQTQLQFNRYLKAGTVGRNYSNVLVLLLRLRQACCHPHLIKDHGMCFGAASVAMADMIKLANELTPEVVSRIKEQSVMNEQIALECPVCMDLAENATIFIPCGHSTCSECFARISDPSQAIAGGDAAEDRSIDIKCPNCRGKVVHSRVIDHNAFKKVHMPELSNTDEPDFQAEIETTDDSSSEDDTDDSDSLKDFIVDDNAVSDETDSEDVKAEETGTEGYQLENAPLETAVKAAKKSKPNKGKGKAREKPPRKTLAELKREGRGSNKARNAYLKRLAREWEPSGKIEKVLEILQATHDRNQGEKTIVFSQFTSLLDLLEVPIYRKQWGYKRYDGSMTSNARNEAVIEFSDKPTCTIMLVSLKAGNSGLNLVAASQVIIFDPFWNPYIEEQAIDRAHRIGQMRPVHVHRILVPETVEDRIVALQEQKRELIEGALDEKASQNIGRLGERELAFLFVSVEISQ